MPRSKTILLVEDSRDDASLFCRALGSAGIGDVVQTVFTAHDAVCYLKGEGVYEDRSRFPFPRAMFLDLKLPDGSGFDVLQWARAQPAFKNLLIVVISGGIEPANLRRAYALGANSFISKPPRIEDLRLLAQGFFFTASG